MILDFDDFDLPQPATNSRNATGEVFVSGMFDMTQEEYRKAQGVANSDLLKIGQNPANYIHSLKAPRDPSKTGALDFGSALHLCLLEPEMRENIIIGPTKSRTTKAFLEFEEGRASEGSLILLEDEYSKLNFMIDSVYAHPTAKQFLEAIGHREKSFFTTDENGVKRKWRPDLDLVDGHGLLGDIKTTASIGDWRENVMWRNPLSTYGYAHTAAYYLDSASLFYQQDVDEYVFIVAQTTVELGMYPVSVFVVTREELQMNGFYCDAETSNWETMQNNLRLYQSHSASNHWLGFERFK